MIPSGASKAEVEANRQATQAAAVSERLSATCPSRLLLRWGSAACDNPTPGHEQHSQAASGLTWTDADAERSVEDRGLV